MKHYSVRGSMPPKAHHPNYAQWRENKELEIVASTAIRALQLAEERCPGIVVHSLQHRGAIEIIEDTAP